MSAHGMNAPSLSVKSVLALSRFSEIVTVFLRGIGAMISHGLLISLLGFLFVVELTEDTGGKLSRLAERLEYYGSDARTYAAVTAKSAGINALVNLVFLSAMGVDTPFVWCFLYFFLDFIPTLGFIIALVPPTFVTLLVYGWKRALLVAFGLVVSNLIVDNVVTPIFMKKAVDVSLLEITLSLLGWTFLLGLIGAILAIPLTLALKRFVAEDWREEQLPLEPSG
jgi:predicted PurR-regulated permease PerM